MMADGVALFRLGRRACSSLRGSARLHRWQRKRWAPQSLLLPQHQRPGTRQHVYPAMNFYPQDHAGNDLPIHKRHTCGQRRTRPVFPRGRLFFHRKQNAQRASGGLGLGSG